MVIQRSCGVIQIVRMMVDGSRVSRSQRSVGMRAQDVAAGEVGSIDISGGWCERVLLLLDFGGRTYEE